MSYAIQGPNHARTVTPAATDLPHPCHAIMIGTSGDVVVLLQGDSATVTLPSLAAGIWHPCFAKQIVSGGGVVVAGWYGSE